jgi:hypothetical protein
MFTSITLGGSLKEKQYLDRVTGLYSIPIFSLYAQLKKKTKAK